MLVVYDPALSGYHEIRPISYQTEEWYNDIGKFTLIVAISDYNIAHLVKRGILYRPEIDQTMVITRVSPDTSQDRITINGYTANWLLNKRSISSGSTLTTVETGLYSALTSNLRSLSNIQNASAAGYTETYNAALLGGDFMDVAIPILDAAGLGQGLSLNTNTMKLVWTIYKGTDLTTGSHAVIFSDEQGTARDLKIEDDESIFKNVFYVSGTLTDGTTVVREIGSATGDDRFECWFDSKLKQSSGETLSAFQARLDSAGAAELAKRVRKLGFSVRIDPGDYGVAYTMGDAVRCVSKRFGFSFTAKINGVKRTLQAQSETVNIVLGEPQLTLIGDIKLWLK